MKKKESKLYAFTKPLVDLYVKIFHKPEYIGLENIPSEGKIILAGTHTHSQDSFLLMSVTKRPVHFMAKKELWEFPKGLLFAHMGLIKVDRDRKSPASLIEAKEYLDDGKVVLIFPEGTLEPEHGKLLPFRIGAVKLAYDTNTKIVPFAIKGHYYNKDLSIRFGKPMKISSDLDKEIGRLKNTIEDLRK